MAQKFSAAELGKIKGAVAWRPAKGDMLTGTVVTIIPRQSDYGVYPVVVLDVPSDTPEEESSYIAWHAMHEVAINELREAKAAPGMRIAATYHGKLTHNSRKDSDGNPTKYHGFSVVPADGAELDTWDFDTDEHKVDPEVETLTVRQAVDGRESTRKAPRGRIKPAESDEPGF
jgi:hypothetical protein